MTVDRSPRVQFPVWDVAESHALMPTRISSVLDGRSAIQGIGLHRGASLSDGSAIATFSFGDLSPEGDELWPARHCALSFADGIMRRQGVSPEEAVDQLSNLISSPTRSTLLRLAEKELSFFIYDVSESDWIAAPVDREAGIYVAGSKAKIPELALVNWKNWADLVVA